MIVEKFVNEQLTSNSYIVHKKDLENVLIIDPGESKPLINWLVSNNKKLQAILVTHSHFDHIYGVNDLIDFDPGAEIYASEFAKNGMLSAKLNHSYYTENPFIIKSEKIRIVKDNDKIEIGNSYFVSIIETPGHNHDCISYSIDDYLFTGDSLIPGHKVHTKSKFSNKLLASRSIQRIIHEFESETTICPGHGEITKLKEIAINELLVI